MRTTVSIEESLLRSARERAARTGGTLSDVVNDSLRVLLADRPASRQSVTLPTFGGSGLRPGVDLEDKEALAAILDEGSDAAR